MTNNLLTEVAVSNLRLVAEGIRYEAVPQTFTFSGKDDQYVQLKIVPLEAGEIRITCIEWDLFEKFKCSYKFADEPKLRNTDKIFVYKVAEESAELEIDLTLNRDMSYPLILDETVTGKLSFKPSASIQNVFLICSHSHLFGFQQKALSNEGEIELELRATKVGDLNVKFLIRYEVPTATAGISRFRFKRIELNLLVKEMFQFVPSFHLSKKVADQFNTQLETRMTLHAGFKQLSRLGKP